MIEKKVFVHSTDSAIAIVEAIHDYQENHLKILSKKNYLKSKFFENHSKILQQLFSNSDKYEALVLKTNLLPESDIYKLFFEHGCKTSNSTIYCKYRINIESLKQTYRLLIDSNFKGIVYHTKIIEKRIKSEFAQKSFEDISDHSFLCFCDAFLSREIPIHQLNYRQQWESKQAEKRNAVEPIFGGVLTASGIKDIFL